MKLHRTKSVTTGADLYCPTVDDLLEPYRKYPVIIQQAILTVNTLPQFTNLTPGQKTVLRVLLTRAEKTDGRKAIFLNHNNASDEGGISVKTIGRAIDLFITTGWIERVGEERDEYGVFTYRKFRFTLSLCDLVGLPRRHRTSVSKPLNNNLTCKGDHLEPGVPAEPPCGDIVLPPELDKVDTEFSLRRSAVAKLRQLACRAGHNLADVVAVARDYLVAKKITGNRAFRYLETLIRKPDDYANRASALAQLRAVAEQVNRNRDRAAAYANQKYRAKNHVIVQIFENTAEETLDGISIGTLGGRQMQALYDDIEAGRLTRLSEC